ncbi:hypothetical protein V6N12_074579 [Hibiscus sabdariffa]|uniref:Uncharacterized protein n=1 Tax=Hibiscus sabdariffa TaxID=183260 RepID=A0ABR2BXN4_9ROSI
MSTGKDFVTRHVVFNEGVFPYTTNAVSSKAASPSRIQSPPFPSYASATLVELEVLPDLNTNQVMHVELDHHEVPPQADHVAPPTVYGQPDDIGTLVIDEASQEHIPMSAQAEQDTLSDIHEMRTGVIIPSEDGEDNGNLAGIILPVDHSSRAVDGAASVMVEGLHCNMFRM